MASAGVEPPQERIAPRLVFLLAVTCGTTVASLYYAQPLLDTIGRALGVSDGTAGLLVTMSQVGYVAGLALLVPLGDLLERRALIVRLLALCSVGLVVCAAAPSFPVLAIALIAVGVSSCAAQIVVPLASGLAAEDERGKVVGTVMSGLLIGILVARTVSGLLAEIGGWRLVFALAAVAMAVLAVVLRRRLPEVAPTSDVAYPSLLLSVLTLVREERVLRERMWLGGLGMAGFSVLWTSIAFLLSRAPFDYGDATIGLFGLAGLAGAGAAQLAGRLADGGHGGRSLTAFLACVLIGWGFLHLGATSVALLLVGIVVLDLGIQGAQITNQSAIYALRPDARSRLTTAYVVSVFLGGVCGSVGASVAWEAGRWDAVSALGAGIAAVALGSWLLFGLRARGVRRAATAGAD